MPEEKKKRDKRDPNAANASNRGELKCFAQRNKVSMNEARAVLGQFGDDRPIALEKANPKSRKSKSARVETGTAKGHAPETQL